MLLFLKMFCPACIAPGAKQLVLNHQPLRELMDATMNSHRRSRCSCESAIAVKRSVLCEGTRTPQLVASLAAVGTRLLFASVLHFSLLLVSKMCKGKKSETVTYHSNAGTAVVA